MVGEEPALVEAGMVAVAVAVAAAQGKVALCILPQAAKRDVVLLPVGKGLTTLHPTAPIRFEGACSGNVVKAKRIKPRPTCV